MKSVIVLLLFILSQVFSQTIDTWERRYGTDGNEGAKQIINMPDGNYLINASKILDAYGFNNMIWLIAIDENGDSLWTKTIGDSVLNHYINDLAFNPSGDLFTATGIDQGGLGQTAYLSKRTVTYDEIWTKTYTNMPSLGIGTSSILCTPDSGCAVIVRKLEGFDASYSWIDKYNKYGDLEFTSSSIFTKEKYYYEAMHDMILTEEGDYLVAMSRAGLDIPESQHIVKFDDSLMVKGGIEFGDSMDESGIEAGFNGSFIVYSSNKIMKIDQDLNIIWEKDLEGYSKCVVKSADGNYFISSSSNTYKVNDDGNIIWTKDFGCTSLVPTDDGGCLAVGKKFNDVWICKFDQDGNYTDINYSYPINSFELHQNYPNPFNPETKIKYSLSSNSDIKLIVYDNTGKEVIKLVSCKQRRGNYEVNFQPENLPSGTYTYRLSIDNNLVASKRMIYLK
ncbi:MAG: T9SS type A sorting domain-containing protein [Bacteroidales bacterium]|jgi:hypothetical protein|nr:T9SS type A sorting domain-containing protein [Bacteroidales bacterium]